MTNPWSHLPNAALVDRVIADAKNNSETWRTAWDAARSASRPAALSAAWRTAKDAERYAAANAVWDAAWDVSPATSAMDAVVALVAWDDCGHLLDLDPDRVRTLALLGHYPAVLLLPAAIILNKSITYSA